MMRAVRRITEGYLKAGAEYVYTGVKGAPDKIRTMAEAASLSSTKIDAKCFNGTLNHTFGSARMGVDAKEFPVDLTGQVRGVQGLYITDASIFPSPSAVNPQATIMALSDLISRRLAGAKDSDYLAEKPEIKSLV